MSAHPSAANRLQNNDLVPLADYPIWQELAMEAQVSNQFPFSDTYETQPDGASVAAMGMSFDMDADLDAILDYMGTAATSSLQNND